MGAGTSLAAGYPSTSALVQALVEAADDRLPASLSFPEVADHFVEVSVRGTEEHANVAALLHELAGVLKAQGDLPGAREKLERSLAICARVFGTEEHPDVAASAEEERGRKLARKSSRQRKPSAPPARSLTAAPGPADYDKS